MGLLDKAKAAATEAAIKAKETAEELQTKRELGQAYGELGQKAFALLESGELSSPELEPVAVRIRALKAQLETTGPEPVAATEPTASEGDAADDAAA
jgi:hypothetical protein